MEEKRPESTSELAGMRSLLNKAALIEKDVGHLEQIGKLHVQTGKEELAVTIADTVLSRNADPIRARAERTLEALKALTPLVSDATDAFDDAVGRLVRTTNGLVAEIRSKRMALAGELREMLVALKDANAFLEDQKEAVVVMGQLVELGERLQALFGTEALGRLAEALLIAAERER